MPLYSPNEPKIGDIIGCSDGDIGVVISTHWSPSSSARPHDSFMVEISWIAGGVCVDPWRSQDFNTSEDMFWIISRA